MARSITLQGFKEYEKRIREGNKTLLSIADAEASASAVNVQRSAEKRAPKNLGNLASRINAQQVKKGVWEVVVGAEYAAYVEFGTRSKVSVPAGLEEYARQFIGPGTGKNPKEMIYAWCKQKGIPQEAWFWIYVSIMIKGIAAQPYLFPSLREEEPKFLQRLKQALQDL